MTEEFLAVKVEGGSMMPTIMPGETIIVKKTKDVFPGEVAVIDTGSYLLVHRVFQIFRFGKKVWLIHKGDASDKWGIARIEQVVGVCQTQTKRYSAPWGLRVLSYLLSLFQIIMR